MIVLQVTLVDSAKTGVVSRLYPCRARPLILIQRVRPWTRTGCADTTATYTTYLVRPAQPPGTSDWLAFPETEPWINRRRSRWSVPASLAPPAHSISRRPVSMSHCLTGMNPVPVQLMAMPVHSRPTVRSRSTGPTSSGDFHFTWPDLKGRCRSPGRIRPECSPGSGSFC